MIKIFIFTFIFSLNGFAQSTLESCSQAGLEYGDAQIANNAVPDDCHSVLLSNQNQFNYKESTNSLIKIIGGQNLIYTEVYQLDANQNPVLFSIEITSGKNSMLKEIQALEYNQGDDRIYVLNKDGDSSHIFSYQAQTGGNNAPMRRLISNELDGATNLKLNHVKQETFVVSTGNAWVKVFNLYADNLGARAENSISTLRSLQGNNTQLIAPTDIAISDDEVFILDSNKILIFNINDSGNVAPKTILTEVDDAALATAVSIEYNNGIVLFN